MDKKEEIKNKVSIVDVAQLYLDLKPAGKYYKALCPFHVEKTPSFFVNPRKDSFVCYGCNEYGDIFSLVEQMEKTSFPEAMNFIIEKFNLQIDKTHQDFSDTAEYKKINKLALNYFQDSLYSKNDNEIALLYLKERKISTQTIEKFQIGYAPNEWDGLYQNLKKHSVSIKKALTIGLLKQKNNKIYDWFKGRIIFPIFSETGSIIGFGGRTVFEDKIKYLNTQETPLFSKGKNFFGFNVTKPSIKEKKAAIVVEGYFDLISLYQNGVSNVIAPLGTALTQDQVYILKRFTDKIYIFFDNDKAGIKAMIRAIKISVPQGIVPHIVLLTDTKDPDEFIVKYGLNSFQKLLNNAQEGFTFLLNQFDSIYDLSIPNEKVKATMEITHILQDFTDPIIKNHYQQMAADFLHIKVDQLIKYQTKKISNTKSTLQKMEIPVSEKIFIQALVASSRKNAELLFQVKKTFNEALYAILSSANIIKNIFSSISEEKGSFESINLVKKNLTNSERALFIDIIESSQSLNMDDLEINLKFSLENFKDKYNRLQMDELTRKIREANVKKNQVRITELMTLKKELRAKLYRRNG